MKAFAGSSMKILQIVCYFYPAWTYGGPPRNVYELSKALVKRGHQVSVYTTDAFDKENRVKEKSGVSGISAITSPFAIESLLRRE
jgi:glycogen synthase